MTIFLHRQWAASFSSASFSHRGERERRLIREKLMTKGKGTLRTREAEKWETLRVSPAFSFPPSFARKFSSKERRPRTRQGCIVPQYKMTVPSNKSNDVNVCEEYFQCKTRYQGRLFWLCSLKNKVYIWVTRVSSRVLKERGMHMCSVLVSAY